MCVCVGGGGGGGGVVNDGLLALHTQLSFSTSGQLGSCSCVEESCLPIQREVGRPILERDLL